MGFRRVCGLAGRSLDEDLRAVLLGGARRTIAPGATGSVCCGRAGARRGQGGGVVWWFATAVDASLRALTEPGARHYAPIVGDPRSLPQVARFDAPFAPLTLTRVLKEFGATVVVVGPNLSECLHELTGSSVDPAVRAAALVESACISSAPPAEVSAALAVVAESPGLELQRSDLLSIAAWQSVIADDLRTALVLAQRAAAGGSAIGRAVEQVIIGLAGGGQIDLGVVDLARADLACRTSRDRSRLEAVLESPNWFLFGDDLGRATAAALELRSIGLQLGDESTAVAAAGCLGEADLRAGRWDRVQDVVGQAVVVAEAKGLSVAYLRSLLARRAAMVGDGVEVRDQVAVVRRTALANGDVTSRWRADAADALGRLGDGNPSATVSLLQPVLAAARTIGRGLPSARMWEADLGEALVLEGRTDEAFDVRTWLAGEVVATASRWGAAAAARLDGIMEKAGPTSARSFRSSIGEFAALGVPFEQARSTLCFGESLRRSRSRTEARGQLEVAHDMFAALGAASWARRASADLQVAVGVSTAPSSNPLAVLTAQERAITKLVAQGLTNREIAGTLYLGVKTVESHLGKIFRKLGCRSRVELAGLATRPVSDSAAS